MDMASREDTWAYVRLFEIQADHHGDPYVTCACGTTVVDSTQSMVNLEVVISAIIAHRPDCSMAPLA